MSYGISFTISLTFQILFFMYSKSCMNSSHNFSIFFIQIHQLLTTCSTCFMTHSFYYHQVFLDNVSLLGIVLPFPLHPAVLYCIFLKSQIKSQLIGEDEGWLHWGFFLPLSFNFIIFRNR